MWKYTSVKICPTFNEGKLHRWKVELRNWTHPYSKTLCYHFNATRSESAVIKSTEKCDAAPSRRDLRVSWLYISHRFLKTKSFRYTLKTCAKEIYYKFYFDKILLRIEYKYCRQWQPCKDIFVAEQKCAKICL